MLRAPKAVGCARNGDHVVRVVVLQGAVSTMGFELVSFRFNVYSSSSSISSDLYHTPWPNIFGYSRALGGSNSLIFIIVVVREIGLAMRGAGEYVGWVGNNNYYG